MQKLFSFNIPAFVYKCIDEGISKKVHFQISIDTPIHKVTHPIYYYTHFFFRNWTTFSIPSMA